MSLSLILQTKDQIIISGDSRGVIQKKGICYATDDNIQKLYHIDDKIFFTGGSQWVTEEALKRYKKSGDKSINALNEIGRQVVKEYEKLCPDAEIERKFELVIATFEEGVSVIYSLSSYEDYRIIKVIGENQLRVCCIGCYRDKIIPLYNALAPKMPVLEIYKLIYDVFADEQMGGSLTVYTFTEKSINSYRSKITDFRPVKRHPSYNINENACTIGPTYGFMAILSDNTARAWFNGTALRMQKGDGTGENWEDVLCFDVVEGTYKFTGSLYITLSDNAARVAFNENGLAMQKSEDEGETWIDVLYFDPVAKTFRFDGTVMLDALSGLDLANPIIRLFTHRGTAQAGASSTITLATTASSTDDTYNNMDIVITSGTGSGQTRTITDYVGSTRVATVDEAWTTTPDDTSVYEVRGPAIDATANNEQGIGQELRYKWSRYDYILIGPDGFWIYQDGEGNKQPRIFVDDTDPSGSYTLQENDIWIDIS